MKCCTMKCLSIINLCYLMHLTNISKLDILLYCKVLLIQLFLSDSCPNTVLSSPTLSSFETFKSFVDL